MLSRLNQVGWYGCLAERLAGFQPMQSLHKDKALSVGPDENRSFLALCQHALGKRFNLRWVKCLTSLYGYIDVLDRTPWIARVCLFNVIASAALFNVNSSNLGRFGASSHPCI
jgi:hypothetical protein